MQDDALVVNAETGPAWARLANYVDRLSRCNSISAAARVATTEARNLVQADGVSLVVGEGAYCRYVDEDAIGPLWKGMRFPKAACISGWCMLHGKTAVVPSIAADPRIPREVYRPTFVRGLVMVPIGQPLPLGAMGFYWSRSLAEVSPEATQLMQTIAGCAETALRRLHLQRELMRQEERMLVVMEEANIAAWTLEIDDLSLQTSLAFRGLLGVPANRHLSYAQLLAILDARSRNALMLYISQLSEKGGERELEVSSADLDGRRQRIKFRMYTETGLSGGVSTIVGFCQVLSR